MTLNDIYAENYTQTLLSKMFLEKPILHTFHKKMGLVFLPWPRISSNKFSFSRTKDSLATWLWALKWLAADSNSWSLSSSKLMSLSDKLLPLDNKFSLMIPSLMKTLCYKGLTLGRYSNTAEISVDLLAK